MNSKNSPHPHHVKEKEKGRGVMKQSRTQGIWWWWGRQFHSEARGMSLQSRAQILKYDILQRFTSMSNACFKWVRAMNSFGMDVPYLQQ
jgi:hypothetical protein